MNGESSTSYLACTPCVPSFGTSFNRGGNRRFLDYQGRGGIISVARWRSKSNSRAWLVIGAEQVRPLTALVGGASETEKLEHLLASQSAMSF